MKRLVYLILFLSLFNKAYSYNEFSRNSSSSGGKLTTFQKVIGFAASVYYVCTGQSEAKKKEQQFAKDRNWQDKVYGRYYQDDFAKHFGFQPHGLRDWSYEANVHQDPIFSRFPLYRFSEFRDFLRWSPCYEQRVCQLRQEIKRGKIFEIDGCSHDEFKTVVLEMASRYPYFPEPSYDCSPYNVIVEPSSVPKKEIQKVDPKQAEQALKRDKITKTMQRPENDLMADYAWYQDIEINELAQPLTVQEQFLIKRVEALTEFGQGTISWREERYTISTDVANLLMSQRIEVQSYTLLYGNQVQHVLHSEILSILDDTASLHYGPLANECKGVTTTLTRFADAGKLHNEGGHVKDACKFADFCWGVLDCIKEAYEFECKLEKAVGRGVLKGGNRFCEKFKDPIKTIKDMRNSLRSLGYLVFELTENIKYRAYVSIKNTLKETADELIDRLKGQYVAPPVEDKGLKEIQQAFEQSLNYMGKVVETAWQNATEENILYTAEEGAAIATEMALNHATFSALSSLSLNSSSVLKEIVELGGPQNFTNWPIRANTIEAAISYEAAIAAEGAIALEAAAAAFAKAAKIAPLAVLSNGSGGDGSNIPVGGGTTPNPPIDIIQAMKQLTQEEKLEASKYFGLQTINGHPIIPPFEHTWVATVARNGKRITGFHQDRMGYYRELGLIRNVKMYPEGFYTAEVYFNGHWEIRSFFPEKWITKDLMDCYYDVVNSPTKVETNSLRTTFIKDRLSGITVKVVIENTGEGVTYFPNLL